MKKPEFETFKKIDNKVTTPFFLVNKNKFIENLNQIKKCFEYEYDNILMSYSLKANHIPYVCKLAKEQGYFAEVVSYLEYQIAKEISYPKSQIIFNGPVKRYEEFREAILGGSLINIDAFYEIEYLKRIREEEKLSNIRIGVRVNIRLEDKEGKSAIYGDQEVGRFGFKQTRDSLGKAIDLLQDMGCNIVSLHGHTSSKDRSVLNFKKIVKTLLAVRKQYQLTPEYINIGGGFMGPIPKGMFTRETYSFSDYASAVGKELKQDEWIMENKPKLVLEPGMSVAADSMSYVTKIYDIKRMENITFAQVDGNVFHFKPSLHKHKLPYNIIQKGKEEGEISNVNFVGSTCMEADVLLENIPTQNIKEGDYIQIDSVGAYTYVMGSNFIQYLPAVVVMENEEINIVRESRNFRNFIEMFNW